VRLALARRSEPVAAYLIANYPAAPAWLRDALGPLPSADSASDLSIFVGDVFGWILLAMGAASVLYFTVFREKASDHYPDDASFAVKQVSADDGTFAGKIMGGGVDALITLPGVTRAADCDIMVAMDEIKVKALDGWHDVTVPIPEASHGLWKGDKWAMVGLGVQVVISWTHGLKHHPGFNPCAYQVICWFQSLGFQMGQLVPLHHERQLRPRHEHAEGETSPGGHDLVQLHHLQEGGVGGGEWGGWGGRWRWCERCGRWSWSWSCGGGWGGGWCWGGGWRWRWRGG
jgi:hypothetical protein